MNRRDFIKSAGLAATIPAIAITCKYEDDEKGANLNLPNENGSMWNYIVYCYERQQGEWTFSQNVRGSFAYQREYMTFDEENDLTWNGYAGWMDGGKLHFTSLEDSQNFVDCHVRTKDDINLVDSIYDIYYKDSSVEGSTEMQVAHYWFNGDTGKRIHWTSHPHDWAKMECS
tara:strand:- start:212 stop:727 length:516 start_codon:yes stop_codon:yes gene_type:complete